MQNSCEENEGKPQNMPKAEEDHPSEDVPQEPEGNPQPSQEGVSQEAEGNLRGGPTQPGQGFKEDTPVRHLDPEKMIRGVDELERLKEEIRRVKKQVHDDALEAKTFMQPSLSCVLQALNSFLSDIKI